MGFSSRYSIASRRCYAAHATAGVGAGTARRAPRQSACPALGRAPNSRLSDKVPWQRSPSIRPNVRSRSHRGRHPILEPGAYSSAVAIIGSATSCGDDRPSSDTMQDATELRKPDGIPPVTAAPRPLADAPARRPSVRSWQEKSRKLGHRAASYPRHVAFARRLGHPRPAWLGIADRHGSFAKTACITQVCARSGH